MKNRMHTWRKFMAAALLVLSPLVSHADTLAVNHVNQRYDDPHGNRLGDNWCWAATSKMVLDYYGYAQALPDIVAFGIGDSTYDTWNYMSGAGTESRTGVMIWEEIKILGIPTGLYTRKSKTLTLNWNGINKIVKHFTNDEVFTQVYTTALTAEQITKEIDDNDAPFFIRIGWNGGGGHFMVCYGTSGGTHSIHDPWFGSYLKADAALRTGTSIHGTATHTWTHTLTTSKILDVVFLFDTTGSMGDDIANAKANANALLDTISTKFKNYRVAVANYRDFPQSPYGETSDYVYRTNLAFSTDKAAAAAAINNLTTGGGRDWPESVYSALAMAMNGDGIGAWRDNPARRIVVLIGDAPGHDPEPWSGGTNYFSVLLAALNPVKPIAIHCLLVGSDIDAYSQFQLIGGGSGGSVVNASDASEVGDGLEAIVESVAESPRFPKGETGAIFPTFTYDTVGAGGMGSDASAILIEIQKYNEKTMKWAKLRVVTIKDTSATLYKSTLAYAVGKYRWRLGFKRPAGKLYLPALDKTVSTPAKTNYETEWTEFERVINPPGAVTKLSPPSQTASVKSVEYSFGAVPGATSYVVQIFQDSKLWKTLTVKPPSKDPGAAVLKKAVTTHKIGSFYTWQVQALNYDRKKVDPFAW